jgi:hypothetical protein
MRVAAFSVGVLRLKIGPRCHGTMRRCSIAQKASAEKEVVKEVIVELCRAIVARWHLPQDSLRQKVFVACNFISCALSLLFQLSDCKVSFVFHDSSVFDHCCILDHPLWFNIAL